MTLALFRPPAASSMAPRIDLCFDMLLLATALVTLGLFATIFYFVIKYRDGSSADRTPPSGGTWKLEAIWTVIPTLVFLGFFAWAAKLYVEIAVPPPDAAPIYVVGKQWMWKIQHPEGVSEIDALHVPVGQPVVLTMTSEDVIHDFFVPAFRVKKDVLPGTYTHLWFRPTVPGTFHFYCSQFCGTAHSSMRGFVEVMTPRDYEAWLAGNAAPRTVVQAGADLFRTQQCSACHAPGGRGPRLESLYGSTVALADGRTARADEAYLRDALLKPEKDLVAGFPPLMPTYQGRLSEMDVMELIVYLKTLRGAR
jgi:cytochrome c oxidase subunit 2